MNETVSDRIRRASDNARDRAIRTRGDDDGEAVAMATVYVGDQINRVADVLERIADILSDQAR